MTREIKFRAAFMGENWDREDPIIVEWEQLIIDHDLSALGSDDIKFMQYTGLKDKNGKEIYEGDIFQFTSSLGTVVEPGYENRYYFEVKYLNEKGMFGYSSNSGIGFIPLVSSGMDIHIIGNIYENPELLTK